MGGTNTIETVRTIMDGNVIICLYIKDTEGVTVQFKVSSSLNLTSQRSGIRVTNPVNCPFITDYS